MSSRYLVMAYGSFALILAWDFIAPRIRLARARRAIALRARRNSPEKKL